MKFTLELSIPEANALFEKGIMKQIDEVVRDLNEPTTKQEPKKETTPKQQPKKETAPKQEAKPQPQQETVTFEEAREELSKLIKAGKQEKVVALFADFGVENLTAVPKEKLGELVEKAKAL